MAVKRLGLDAKNDLLDTSEIIAATTNSCIINLEHRWAERADGIVSKSNASFLWWVLLQYNQVVYKLLL